MKAVFLISLVFSCVLGSPSDPLVFPINNQSFGHTFSCPPGSSCIFQCEHFFAACLSTHFLCLHNNTCQVHCSSPNSCSYLSYSCSPDSNCSLHCAGQQSCALVKSGLQGIAINATGKDTGVQGNSIGSILGAVFAQSFAENGNVLLNFKVTGDYSLQLLCVDLPKDSNTTDQLLKNFTTSYNNLLSQLNIPGWTNPPYFDIRKSNDFIISVSFDYTAVAKWTFHTHLLFTFPLFEPYLVVDKAAVVQSNSTIFIYFITPFNLQFFLPRIQLSILDLVTTLFSYPNSTFVTVDLHHVNNTYLEVVIFLYPYHCTLPIPFWGTYCLDTYWYSNGDISIDSFDLIASQTVHDGDLTIGEESSLYVIGGSLVTTSLILNPNGNLNVIYSNITVSNSIILNEHSSLEISSNSAESINTKYLKIGSETNLIVHLKDSELQQFENEGSLSIVAMNANSMSGTFQNIVITTSQGSIQSCTNLQYNNKSLVVVLFPCPDGKISIELIAGVTGGVLGLVLFIAIGSWLLLKYQRAKAMDKLKVQTTTN